MTEFDERRVIREREKALRAEKAEEALAASSSEKDYYNNNNNNRVHAPGRVCPNFWTPEDGERILNAYIASVADTMTQPVARMIEGAYQAGLTVDEIIMAIEETGFAPHPSPRYLKAILKNWIETGVSVSYARHYSKTNNSKIAWWKPDGK